MITEFKGQYRFLSNFYLAEVEFEGATYPSVEHAYQAAKTIDPVKRRSVLTTTDKRTGQLRQTTPGEAKDKGYALDLREGWDAIKVSVMIDIVRSKFSREPLRQWLLNTGDQELIEGNWWGDQYWGVCKGEGQNMLGKILMKIREELRNESK